MTNVQVSPDNAHPEGALLLPRQVQEMARDLGVQITRDDAIGIANLKLCGDPTPYEGLIAQAGVLDDSRRTVILDRLATTEPACIDDLLDIAARVMEAAR